MVLVCIAQPHFREGVMDGEQIKELVRSRYTAVAKGSAACCGSTKRPEEASRGMGYSEAELTTVPAGANLGLGCGNPQAIAAMQPGEIVIDLGSGAGAASSDEIEHWLAAASFGDIVIGVKSESRELVKTWAPGRGVEDCVASATIEARKPVS